MLRFLVCMLCFVNLKASAAEIQKVRVFAGKEHARILIINDIDFKFR